MHVHGEQDCVELSTLMYFSFSEKVGKGPAEKIFQGRTERERDGGMG